MRNRIRLFVLIFLVLILVGLALWVIWFVTRPVTPTSPLQEQSAPQQQEQPVQKSDLMYHPPARTKTFGCVIVHSMPDPACTPGGVDTSLTLEIICTQKTKERRNTTKAIDDETFAEYGLSRKGNIKYENDHHISIEIGGSDNDINNHWPQRYENEQKLKAGKLSDDELGAHAKDKVENWFHQRVCKTWAGTAGPDEVLSLADAQRMIATNWVAAYHEWEHRNKH